MKSILTLIMIQFLGASFGQANPTLGLSKAELKKMMGAQGVPDSSGRFSLSESAFRMESLEGTSLDWRNKDGVNWVSPILDQGNCGSCVAFATVGVLETQATIASGLPWFQPSYSTQALFACGGGRCASGWRPSSAARFAKSVGVPDESCAPYTSGATGLDVSCNSICGDAAQRSLKITNFRQPTNYLANVNAVKAALARGTLMTTMNVYEDFVTYRGGIYKHTTGDELGGHAIAIVGYDDATRSWLIRNSWGPDWGEGGFARVSWDDTSGVGDETWLLEVAPAKGYASIVSPSDREILAGASEFKIESTFENAKRIQLVIQPAKSKTPVQQVTCADLKRCDLSIDTTSLVDGIYETFVRVELADGTATQSPYETFYVLNAQPAPTLSFEPQAGLDLNKPLSGRPVFDIRSSSGNAVVPLQAMEFQVLNARDEVVYRRGASKIVSEMTFGWRTITVPNGEYRLRLVAAMVVGGVRHEVVSRLLSVQVKN